MPTFISRTDAENNKVETDANRNYYNFEKINAQTFSRFTEEDFKTMNVSISWLGSYEIKEDVFTKETCPKCGKEHSLKPYLCEAVLSCGAHIILFYCQNCGEQFATNDYRKYFREIANYIAEHRINLPRSKKLPPCMELGINGKIIWNEEAPI